MQQEQEQVQDQLGQDEQGDSQRPPVGRRGGGDLYGEVAGGGGRVRLRGHGEALESAGLVLLVLHLEEGVERVGCVAVAVHATARRPVSQRGAVGERARVVDVVGELLHGVAAGVGVDDAPRPGQVLHAARRHQHRVLPLPAQVHRVLGLPVVPEDAPVPLEVAGSHALDVLVQETEQVHLDVLVRPRRGAGVRRQTLEQAVVEPLRVRAGGVLVAVGGPADLANDDGHVAVPDRLERRNQGVEVGVEHVGVGHAGARVHQRRRVAVEEGEVHGEVVVEEQADERVDVHREGRAVVAQELHHLRHQVRDVGAPPPRRRHRVVLRGHVHVGVQRHRGLDGVPEPGLVQCVLNVLQRRERHLVERAVVGR